MVTPVLGLWVGLLCLHGIQGTGYDNYNRLLDELALYERNGLMGTYGYDDGQIVSRSGEDAWNVPYREPTINDQDLFSEAALRDQEFLEQSPLWGYQSVSGGTGDGKENPKEIKTDKVLPAYCNPPNPCPIGFTAKDNCVEQFSNTPENNRRLMREQDCPCDTEHMVSCPKGQERVNTKSHSVDGLNSMLQDLQLDDSMAENPYLASQQRLSLAAKKSPHMIKKRAVEYYNPYLEGKHKRVAAKKGFNEENRLQRLKQKLNGIL